MIMLPQAVCSPMDSDSLESSLPPDICLKSCSVANEPDESGAWKNAPQCWTEDHLRPISEDEANNVTTETQSLPPVAQSDLLQSACQKTGGQEKCAEEAASVSGALPDLCEGASSSSRLSSDSDLSQASPVHHRLPQVWEQMSTSSTVTNHVSVESGHEALGAKPKVFKYKSATKRTDLDKGSRSVLKTSSKKGCRDKTRTIDASHVQSSISKQENFDISRVETEVLSQSAFSPTVISSENSSTNEEQCSVSKVPSNSDENDVNVLDNKTHCDESNDDTLRPENDAAIEKCIAGSDEILLEEESPSLMEEYLLYDSRPISLVACGIWDCDSRSGVADCASIGLSGLVLMRNNLQSASHPMFAKWPCEAYIPSHILVEVAFNSHGTSLGAAAGGGAVSGAYGDSDALARENEQVKLAKRMALIQHLPQGTVDAGTSVRECVICMMDLIEGERVRYLPCMHLYHTHCIDDWFQRAFTCPSCLEPVDAALLNTYNTT